MKNYSSDTISIQEKLSAIFRRRTDIRSVYRVLIAICIIFIIFIVFSKDFVGPIIFPGILLLGAELGIITIGETYVIMAGEIDLSIASVYGWGALFAMLLSNSGLPFGISFLVAIIFGGLVGLLNWVVTVRFRVPALITTLGSMWLFRGLLWGIFSKTFFSYKGGKSLLLSSFGGNIWIFPRLFIWFLAIAIIFGVILYFTKFGNWVLATGGHRETASALGVNTSRTKLFCFMISSCLAAFAGAAYLGRMDYFLTSLGMSKMGFGLETEAIAASVMGGTAFTGGVGNVIAVCIAAFALSSFRSGLILIGVSSYWIDGTVAVLLIIFCVLQGTGRRR